MIPDKGDQLKCVFLRKAVKKITKREAIVRVNSICCRSRTEQWIRFVVKGRHVWRVVFQQVSSWQPVGSRDDQLTNAQPSLPFHTRVTYTNLTLSGQILKILPGPWESVVEAENPFIQIADLGQSWVCQQAVQQLCALSICNRRLHIAHTGQSRLHKIYVLHLQFFVNFLQINVFECNYITYFSSIHWYMLAHIKVLCAAHIVWL